MFSTYIWCMVHYSHLLMFKNNMPLIKIIINGKDSWLIENNYLSYAYLWYEWINETIRLFIICCVTHDNHILLLFILLLFMNLYIRLIASLAFILFLVHVHDIFNSNKSSIWRYDIGCCYNLWIQQLLLTYCNL